MYLACQYSNTLEGGGDEAANDGGDGGGQEEEEGGVRGRKGGRAEGE